ncbi:MAG: helix-turn-helix domain-containing protein [Halovenus sp.]
MTGVRAEFVFEQPASCPVAAASEETAESLRDISWAHTSDDTVAEQFTASRELSAIDAEEVFDYGPQRVYEFERDRDRSCICSFIEESLGPVRDVYATDGDLHVTLHAGDMAKLRELLGDLDDRFGSVRIEYLVRGRAEASDAELVPVDLRRLTDRQREVLQVAHEMGYFEYPRDANASEIAETLDIQPSTFTEHLNAAQTKLLDELLVRE